MRICKKCVLPEISSLIEFNQNGLCHNCTNQQLLQQNTNPINERILLKTFAKYRNKNKTSFDSLLMCSGGKDSIAALYYSVKRYNLSPLVFTFDNGFEDQIALDNIKKATTSLGVEWIYQKSHFMDDMYKEAIMQQYGFPICALCSLWYMQLVLDIAKQFNIKLIIGGWTEGQATSLQQATKIKNGAATDIEFDFLCQDIPAFIDKMRQLFPKYASFPRTMAELNKKYKYSKKTKIISPHWFLPYTPDEYEKIITSELGWIPLDSSYPKNSTNCHLSIIGSQLSLDQYGMTHFHIEQSKLIRRGKLTRNESLKTLEISISKKEINLMLQKLKCHLE